MAGTNPILDELGGLSPGAQQALLAAHNSTALTPPSTPPVDQGLQSPSKIQKPAQIGAPPTAQPAGMPSTVPNMGSSPMPSVQAPRGTLQGDENERGRLEASGPGITQIHSKIENSEFGQNHPTLGKIAGYGAEIPLRILEAAGSTLGPLRSAEQLLPGTQAHHAMEMHNLNTDIGKESEENLQGAQTNETNAKAGETTARAGLTNLEAGALPQKNADTHDIAQATVGHLDASTDALKDPQAKTAFEAWQRQNPQGTVEDWLKLQADNKPSPKENDFEQYYKDYLADQGIKDSAHARLVAREKYAAAGQLPQRAPIVNMFVPGADGQSTLQTIRPGQSVGPGAQTAAGLNAMNTPTTQQRTAAGRAETVVAMAPEVMSRIDSMASKLGPVEGRWNEFMQGKLGSDDPDFAALRSDLLMMSSAVALAHAQGRLPENLREEFDHAINAPKQTPQNLKATIQTMIPWLKQVQNQGQRGTGGSAPAAAPAGKWNPVTGRYE